MRSELSVRRRKLDAWLEKSMRWRRQRGTVDAGAYLHVLRFICMLRFASAQTRSEKSTPIAEHPHRPRSARSTAGRRRESRREGGRVHAPWRVPVRESETSQISRSCACAEPAQAGSQRSSQITHSSSLFHQGELYGGKAPLDFIQSLMRNGAISNSRILALKSDPSSNTSKCQPLPLAALSKGSSVPCCSLVEPPLKLTDRRSWAGPTFGSNWSTTRHVEAQPTYALRPPCHLERGPRPRQANLLRQLASRQR